MRGLFCLIFFASLFLSMNSGDGCGKEGLGHKKEEEKEQEGEREGKRRNFWREGGELEGDEGSSEGFELASCSEQK